MALPEASAWAIVIGIVLVAAVVGLAAPRTPRGEEHRTAEVARPDRRRRPARRHGDHLLEPRRRRYPELHLPGGCLRAPRCDRRGRFELVQWPALLLRRN